MTIRQRTARRPGAVVTVAARRRTSWSDTLVSFTVASSAAGGAELMGTGLADTQEKRGYTLARTIVCLAFMPAVPWGTTGVQRIQMGILVASNDATAAGALADPNDAVDYPTQGWVWRDEACVVNQSVGSPVGIIPAVVMNRDIRAQRKLDRSSLSYRLFNSAVDGTATTVRVVGLIRNLYRLP